MKRIGYLTSNARVTFDQEDFSELIRDIRSPIHMVFEPVKRMVGLATGGEITNSDKNALPLIASFPTMYPEWLGDRSFLETHNIRFAYVGGAMARGIASSKMVIELAKIGMLCFFGSAGLRLEELEKEIIGLNDALGKNGISWGANLIHTPNDLELEESIIKIYLKYGVKRISAAAFMQVTTALIWFSAKGLKLDINGKIIRENYVFAKVSHPEVAKHFLLPAPEAILNDLVLRGKLSPEEAEIAKMLPVSEDIDIESDSGGHTDNRPLSAIFSTIDTLRRDISKKYGYTRKIRLGAAGGIGTPQAVASAFALGASHVVVGSVHQSTLEAGTSKEVKQLLAQAKVDDFLMTASADMFEMGVKVQVLKRGTMMGVRGNILYDIYKRYDSIEDIPLELRLNIEKNIFRMPLEETWEKTKTFFLTVEPEKITLCENDKKMKMALIFRWYVGNSSRWPIVGQKDRLLDYQIWCGPSMGAFNDWVKGTYLEQSENRNIAQIALNLMEGGAIITRAHQMRTYGLPLKEDAFSYKPEQLRSY